MGVFNFWQRKADTAPPIQPPIEAEEEKSVRIIRGYSAVSGNPTVKQLAGNAPVHNDPRQLMAVSRVVVEMIPEVSAGLGIHLDVVGNLIGVDTKNKKFADEFARWIQSVRWKLELDHPFNQSVGLHEFTRIMAWNAMIDGMVFVRAVDNQGEDNLSARQRDVILRLHDSERFVFSEFETDKFWLEYETRGNVVLDVRETEAFKAMAFTRSPSWPWGLPITYNALYEAKTAIRAGSNQSAAQDLLSKAAMLTLIGIQPDAKLLENDEKIYVKLKEEALEQANKVLEELTTGIKTAQATGTRHHGFQAFTTPIGVNTVSMAEGVQMNPNYAEERKRQLCSVVLGCGIQPDFVGLSETSGGIGSEKYETTARAMMGTGLRMRRPIERLIRHFWELHCKRNSILIERDYAFIWDGLLLTEHSAKLKAEEASAKIAEIHMKNMALAYESFGVVAANTYAKINGLSWVAPSINPNPPQE